MAATITKTSVGFRVEYQKRGYSFGWAVHTRSAKTLQSAMKIARGLAANKEAIRLAARLSYLGYPRPSYTKVRVVRTSVTTRTRIMANLECVKIPKPKTSYAKPKAATKRRTKCDGDSFLE